MRLPVGVHQLQVDSDLSETSLKEAAVEMSAIPAFMLGVSLDAEDVARDMLKALGIGDYENPFLPKIQVRAFAALPEGAWFLSTAGVVVGSGDLSDVVAKPDEYEKGSFIVGVRGNYEAMKAMLAK